MKLFAVLAVIATNFLPICTNSVYAVNHETYSDVGNRTYKALYSIHEQGNTLFAMKQAKTCAHADIFNDSDHVHFLVLWMNLASLLELKEERNQADKELKELINSSEDAFWEFRSYYDC